MYEIDVECRSCGEIRAERCDASGIAPGVAMECPNCERSARHDPVGDLERVKTDQFRQAIAEIDSREQQVQSGAYDR